MSAPVPYAFAPAPCAIQSSISCLHFFRYGGRKELSRAFRSRFLEMHVGEIPDSELVTMLNKRCGVADSRAKMMVAVMRELQRRRKNANILAGKYGFITPRDLFRWAERHRDADTSSMDSCAIAGVMLLLHTSHVTRHTSQVSCCWAKLCATATTNPQLQTSSHQSC